MWSTHSPFPYPSFAMLLVLQVNDEAVKFQHLSVFPNPTAGYAFTGEEKRGGDRIRHSLDQQSKINWWKEWTINLNFELQWCNFRERMLQHNHARLWGGCPRVDLSSCASEECEKSTTGEIADGEKRDSRWDGRGRRGEKNEQEFVVKSVKVWRLRLRVDMDLRYELDICMCVYHSIDWHITLHHTSHHTLTCTHVEHTSTTPPSPSPSHLIPPHPILTILSLFSWIAFPFPCFYSNFSLLHLLSFSLFPLPNGFTFCLHAFESSLSRLLLISAVCRFDWF